jgi:hypothetical protein
MCMLCVCVICIYKYNIYIYYCIIYILYNYIYIHIAHKRNTTHTYICYIYIYIFVHSLRQNFLKLYGTTSFLLPFFSISISAKFLLRAIQPTLIHLVSEKCSNARPQFRKKSYRFERCANASATQFKLHFRLMNLLQQHAFT